MVGVMQSVGESVLLSYPRSHTHKSILAPRRAGMQDLTPRTELPPPTIPVSLVQSSHCETLSKIHEEMRVKYIRVGGQKHG